MKTRTWILAIVAGLGAWAIHDEARFVGVSRSQVVAEPTPLVSGDILVSDFGARKLFKVNPVTGERESFSDFLNRDYGDQGPISVCPRDVTVSPAGNIYVNDICPHTTTSPDTGRILEIDPVDGSRTILSDFRDASQGDLGTQPLEMATDSLGQIYVIDLAGVTPLVTLVTRLTRIDPETGNRTTILDYDFALQLELGTNIGRPEGIAVDPTSGDLILTDSARDKLFRFSSDGATRSVIDDFLDISTGEPSAPSAWGVVVEQSGNIFAVTRFGGTDGRGLLVKFDPIADRRSIVSDFGDPNQGPVSDFPLDIVFDGSGNFLVVDLQGGPSAKGLLFRVFRDGTREVLSDFNEGPLELQGFHPFGVAVYTTRGSSDGVIDGAAGGTIVDLAGSGASFQVDPNVLPPGDTDIIIEVFPNPGANIPPGFIGSGTLFVDITLDPDASPLPFPPGATITLPLDPNSALVPGDPVSLFRFNPVNNTLLFRGIRGSVDPSGTTATFSGIVFFSIFVGLEPSCGDVNDDGTVDGDDVVLFRGHLADPVRTPLPPSRETRCTLIGAPGPCSVLDVVVLRRALAVPALPPGIAPVCEAAL